jgi:5-methylcytosine-specific restriction endonuclease McrA
MQIQFSKSGCIVCVLAWRGLSAWVAVVTMLRRCFREPVAELELAAGLLAEAARAHQAGNSLEASRRIVEADLPALREWTESLWGKASPWRRRVSCAVAGPAPGRGLGPRMPGKAMRAALIQRDGYHCRFCGVAVIRHEVRQRIAKLYPQALRWGRSNAQQHAAFQAMWLQYDHLQPHTRGGPTTMENLVIACAPCNFCRMEASLEEVGLLNPLEHEPRRSSWDGLESFA